VKGCLKYVGIGVALLAVILIVAAIASSGFRSSTQQQAVAEPTSAGQAATAPAATQKPQAAAAATQPPPTAVPKPTTAPPPTAAPKPAGDRGIVFGEVVQLGANTVGVPTTNASELVKSFTVTATFKNGDTIAGTASGAVNDLPPGQRRAVTLLSQALPATFDSARVEVTTMVQEARSTPGATAAAKLTFGKPTIKALGNTSSIDVEVTNTDTAQHSAVLGAGFYEGDQLVGVGSGALNDIAGGQTKTATLLVQGKASGDPELTVNTVVR
jgi:hypothetical protein